jgi:GH15 family glucan-1,4-alpha-glucosidase
VTRYPSIGDYGFIGDCHCTALVSRTGSIDWCCMPRFDSDSCFGRLLGWDDAGYCSISPLADARSERRYIGDSLVLETTFAVDGGSFRVIDLFAMHAGGRELPHRQLIRIIEGIEGPVDVRLEIVPRFDYGQLRPWMRYVEEDVYTAIGSNDGLLIWSDLDLRRMNEHDLEAEVSVTPGRRWRLSIQFAPPERLDVYPRHIPTPEECDERLQETLSWWEKWAARIHLDGSGRSGARRSAIVLKGLAYAPTGAIVAAATTSLPEAPGGERNWDYRYSWVRDSVFTVSSLNELGATMEADFFRRFIERSAAGNADDLQIMYRVDGDRRLPEFELPHLEGYRGARPVRIGNRAADQVQHDVYGELLELAWRWHERGRTPREDYWRFLSHLVDAAATRWTEPDRGIWEVRGDPQHFVHSKVMCWVALDRGLRLAEATGLDAPSSQWAEQRDAIRAAVETRGYDDGRGVFQRAFDGDEVDASLLLLPAVGFVDYTDPRMVRTVAAVRAELEEGGLIARYRTPDGLAGNEGVFLACTFWLAECLAYQGRRDEALEVFERAASTANDLGLFAEEYLIQSREMTGNFPQGLTHLAHIEALVALAGSVAG